MHLDQSTTDPSVDDFQRDFARQYVAEGRALGWAEGVIEGRESGERMGRCALLLRLLTRRFGDLPLAVWARIHAASVQELDTIGDRLLSAESLEEALGPRLR